MYKKKIFILFLILALATMIFTSCGSKDEKTLTRVINIATLNGPTGMGAVDLMDETEKYNVTVYQAATDVVPKIISGEVDVACLPSNMAAVLYNKTEGRVVAVSPMVLGVLSILGNNAEINNLSDLKGMTIVSAGKGGTPEYALQKVLEYAGLKIYEDVNVTWLSSHADVNALLLSTKGTIALMPEPFCSTALSKNVDGVKKLFDMNSLWSEATGEDFPMGVLVARKDFAENNREDLEILLKDLQSSIDDVNTASDEVCDLLVSKGFIGNAALAKQVIPNCSLVLYIGSNADKGISMLKTFNQTMFNLSPDAVGGKLPGEDLYFK